MKPRSMIYLGLIVSFCICSVLIGYFLYQKSKYIDSATNYKITETIEQLKAVDARWNEDVLKARLRLNKNYDPIVDSIQKSINLGKTLSGEVNKIADQFAQVNVNLNHYQDKTAAKIDTVQDKKLTY